MKIDEYRYQDKRAWATAGSTAMTHGVIDSWGTGTMINSAGEITEIYNNKFVVRYHGISDARDIMGQVERLYNIVGPDNNALEEIETILALEDFVVPLHSYKQTEGGASIPDYYIHSYRDTVGNVIIEISNGRYRVGGTIDAWRLWIHYLEQMVNDFDAKQHSGKPI